MALTGTYKLQKNEFYNEYLKALNVGWFQRRTDCALRPSLTVTESSYGTINLKTAVGVKPTIEKTITLGEEHTEMLPNGQESKGVTVKEGDSNLITRLKTDKGNSIEVRREFAADGMTQIIRWNEKDIVAIRYYKRET